MMEGMSLREPSTPRWPWLVGLALGLACAKGTDDGISTGVVLGSASVDDGADDSETAMGSEATEDGASGQVDGSGDATAGDDGPPGDSSGEPAPSCPVEADDVPCEVCGKGACCAEYLACVADEMCACALDCYLAGTSVGDCFVTCGAAPAALDLFNCAAPACEGICQ